MLLCEKQKKHLVFHGKQKKRAGALPASLLLVFYIVNATLLVFYIVNTTLLVFYIVNATAKVPAF